MHKTTKSRMEQVRLYVGQPRVCMFIVWYEMEMRWWLSTPGSTEYILHVTLSTSYTPASPHSCRGTLKIYLEDVNKRVWRCTWRRSLCTLQSCNRVGLMIHLEAVIKRMWRYPWRPWSSDFRDTLGGCCQAGLEMHLKTGVMRVSRYTSKPWSREFADALGGHNRPKLEEYMEPLNLEAVVQWCGATGTETLFIGYLVIVGMLRIEYNMVCKDIRDWLGAGDCRSCDNAVYGVCSTQWML
jgi:hypothetical protein